MIKNKKILVTGTTSGLGKSIVEYFSKENEIISINSALFKVARKANVGFKLLPTAYPIVSLKR